MMFDCLHTISLNESESSIQIFRNLHFSRKVYQENTTACNPIPHAQGHLDSISRDKACKKISYSNMYTYDTIKITTQIGMQRGSQQCTPQKFPFELRANRQGTGGNVNRVKEECSFRINFTPFWPAYLMLGPHHQIVDYTCVSTIMSSRYRIIVGTRLAPYT